MEKVIMLNILMMAVMVQKGVGGLHEDDSRLLGWSSLVGGVVPVTRAQMTDSMSCHVRYVLVG